MFPGLTMLQNAVAVTGTFAPKNFRSQELMLPVATRGLETAPCLEASDPLTGFEGAASRRGKGEEKGGRKRGG